MKPLDSLQIFVDKIFLKLAKFTYLFFVLSLGALFFGWIGYAVLDGYEPYDAIKMHVHIITALSSPFAPFVDTDPPTKILGQLYAIGDLSMTWLLLPTMLPIVLERAQTARDEIKKQKKELAKLAYESVHKMTQYENLPEAELRAKSRELYKEMKKKLTELKVAEDKPDNKLG